MNIITRFVRDERGASLVEYTLLLAIITAAVVATIGNVGAAMDTTWTTVLSYF